MFKRVVLLFLFMMVSSTIHAKLILSAPPREKSAEDGKAYYGPIASELSKYIGQEVVYEYPTNWTAYARDMRAGKYDLVFDGPHFVAWRMEHVNHEPVAKLDGQLQFYILVMKDRAELTKMESLLGKKLCGLASPNLGALAAFNLYQNPIIQPSIHNVKGGGKNVLKTFLSGECDAAIVRDALYMKLPQEKKDKIKILAKSRSMPNQSISASKRIDEITRRKIASFFVSNEGKIAADKLLTRFSRQKKYFVHAKANEFEGLNELLEGVVFGW